MGQYTQERRGSAGADKVFTVGTSCLCLPDLLLGILVCDYVLADHTEFRFVKLPRECSDDIKLNPEGGRGLPEQHRSMCCVEHGDDHIIKFISMNGHGQGRDEISAVSLTIWTLDQPCNPMSKWKAGRTYSRISDFWTNPICTHQLRTPSCPVLSMLQDDVIYISIDDMVDDCREPCMLSLDMKGQRVLSAFIPPPGSRVTPLPEIFASPITMS